MVNADPSLTYNDHDQNFGHDRLKMDQDLPHLYTDDFSRDDPTNDATEILDEV